MTLRKRAHWRQCRRQGVDSFSAAVLQGKMNGKAEDNLKEVSGASLIILTAIAMAIWPAVRTAYGLTSVGLGAGLLQWRTGRQSL